MLSRKSRITSLTVLAVLAFSAFTPALAFAAPLANNDKDWQYVNANSWGWNYSPETKINKDNVQNLEVKWIFPMGSKAVAPAGLQSVPLTEGTTAPPIMRNGVVYVTTNFLRTYAIDAKNGKQLWTHDYTVNLTDLGKRLPIDITGSRVGGGHLHGFRYWEAGDAVLIYGMACDFVAIDAKTGKDKFRVNDLCLNIPGNVYKYQFGGIEAMNGASNVGTYDKGKQFIFVLSSSSITQQPILGSRHVTMGIDMDSKQIAWRVFSSPPNEVINKDWALQECDIGYFQTFTCTDVAAKNRAGLEWDWAFPNEAPSKWGGVSANWGQPIVDEDTGILYTQTGNQSPYANMSMTPGPRLYGSTIMAIDMNAGKRLWWLQPFPRDPYDYDCNWAGILADVPTLGKVYMKGCKEGRLYVMDAKTGKPVRVTDVVNEQIQWGQVTSAAEKEVKQGGVRYHLTDPFSYSDLREWKSITDGKYCSAPCQVYPHWSNGLFATDMSYDPETATLFHYAVAIQSTVIRENPYVERQTLSVTRTSPIINTTLVARDAATGNVKWTWFYSAGQQRSHMVITRDLVFSGFTDGYMRFFDKNKGTLLREINLGAQLTVGTIIGQDSAGDQKIIVPVGTRLSNTPGNLIALGLSDKAAQTTTVTTTTATTSTITTTSATTTTATTTVTTTSATTSISTTTATTTATTATTVISTQPAQTQTTTVVSSVTETTGLPSEVTYAAVGVAVIALAAAAVLVMRKK
ncbi:MAG: PQQ-binding-like beta-propeller repeat protein [Thaumarchaeota archaeon]|nr:PQQ-binding-like beta-propeller repeat protein [Nitrososphaerota archaeon]